MSLNIVDYSSLPRKFTTLYTPEYLNKIAWWDAADFSTFTLVGSLISQWRDKSIYLNHVNQTVNGSRPTYNASDAMFGGRPSVYSPNTWKFLTLASSLTIRRMYFVTYFGTGLETIWPNHCAIVGSSDGSVRLTGRLNGTRVFDGGQDSKNFDYNGFTYRNGSDTNTNWQLNGMPITAELFMVEALVPKTAVYRLIGNNQSFTWWNGGIGEMIFTNGSESYGERKKIEGYLAWKWGIDSKLPSNHPYKLYAPYV